MNRGQVQKLWEQAKEEHRLGVTSPFFNVIQELREKLSQSTDIIEYTDYGSGTNNYLLEGKLLEVNEDFQIEEKPLAELAERLSIKGAFSRFLPLLVKDLDPKNCVELGAGYGFSGASILLALEKNARFVTLEGCPILAKYARENFLGLGFPDDRFTVVEGKFKDTLYSSLIAGNKLDFVFIDGHNNPEMRCQYIETILPFLNDGAIVLMRAIKWKKQEKGIDMGLSWIKINAMKEFSTLLEEEHFGVVVCNKGNL